MKTIKNQPFGVLAAVFSWLAVLWYLTQTLGATDIKQYVTSQSISVTNSSATAISAGLNSTTTVQLYISPNSTAQIFTLTLPNGTAIPVPSGNTLTLRFASNLASTDSLGSVITGTGSATLIVLSIREVKQ